MIIDQRINKANSDIEKYKRLESAGYVTESAVKDQVDSLQLLRSQSVENKKQINELKRLEVSNRKEYDDSFLRIKKEINDSNIQLETLNKEVLQNKLSLDYKIVASDDGYVNITNSLKGQSITNKPIAMLVPASVGMKINLYANSRAIGFLKKGQRVKLRYHAYSHQKYGQFDGVVEYVSLAPIESNDLPTEHQVNREDQYKITINPMQQEITIDNESKKLTAGMVVEASIFQEKRKIYKWIIDPLKNISESI
ncbi:hypothetical protein [Comamonas sp. wu1-DMT]|uniref:hypothetical protein n=1 Tax=Comamonas sp. wu1-DMT TaxID=3126390 RepID=UPI0032E425B1